MSDVLRKALDFIESVHEGEYPGSREPIIAALRAALAHPVPDLHAARLAHIVEARTREDDARLCEQVGPGAAAIRAAAELVAAAPVAEAVPPTEQDALRELLTWRMCSDPWPGGNMQVVDGWLNAESRKAGYSDWIDAYHALGAATIQREAK